MTCNHILSRFIIAVLSFSTLSPGVVSCSSSGSNQEGLSDSDLRGADIKLKFSSDSIYRRPNMDGDNWHTTWAADGNQYVLQCDGQGYNTRLWRLTGPPSNFKFEAVDTHPGPKEPPP